jgi:hypothetical protein
MIPRPAGAATCELSERTGGVGAVKQEKPGAYGALDTGNFSAAEHQGRTANGDVIADVQSDMFCTGAVNANTTPARHVDQDIVKDSPAAIRARSV